jgi:hypothetical protein
MHSQTSNANNIKYQTNGDFNLDNRSLHSLVHFLCSWQLCVVGSETKASTLNIKGNKLNTQSIPILVARYVF